MSLTTLMKKTFTKFTPSLSRQFRGSAMNPRMTPSANRPFSATAQHLRSMDDLPGNFDMDTSELTRVFTDSVGLFGEKYQIAKDHGVSSPMYKMNAGTGPSVVLLSHDLVKQWHQYELQGRARRGGLPEVLTRLFGRGVNDLSGPDHAEWRKKAMPAFKPNMIDRFTPFVQNSAQNLMLDDIARQTTGGDSVQLNLLAKRFTFEIGAKFVFGPLLNDEERERAFTAFQEWTQFTTPAVIGPAMQDPENPGAGYEACLRAREALHEQLTGKYLEAQELTATNSWDSTYGDDSECILRSLLDNDAVFTRPHYTVADYVDGMLGITFAAYDTSATSMTNMVYTMWENPEETSKVRDAILAHPELSKPDTMFTFDMLKSCNDLECFINESMRVHSFLPSMVPRVVHDEDGVEIGGYLIPKGTSLVIPIQFLQMGDGSWTDPLEFKPSRFDKSQGQKRADRGSVGAYNHIPFATGLHKCLGQHLAMLELRSYTTLLLRDWEFELDESRLDEEGTVNHMNLSQSLPHYNVYLKNLRRRQM